MKPQRKINEVMANNRLKAEGTVLEFVVCIEHNNTVPKGAKESTRYRLKKSAAVGGGKTVHDGFNVEFLPHHKARRSVTQRRCHCYDDLNRGKFKRWGGKRYHRRTCLVSHISPFPTVQPQVTTLLLVIAWSSLLNFHSTRAAVPGTSRSITTSSPPLHLQYFTSTSSNE